MPNPSQDISVDQRLNFLKMLPCFSMFDQDEIRELSCLMAEQSYLPGDVIVKENELVNSVYILVSGQAEVCHEYENKKIPVAIIARGESIGLNDVGLFSISGERTATVNALSKVTALTLSIKDLHQFLEKHSHLHPAMYSTSAQLLRLRLIKQSLPFNRLSNERLNWLAKQVEEVTVPEGHVIFKQGDAGDCCYLIRSGQVEIVSKQENGDERRLALLTAPMLFGEATLITRSPRNATARTLAKTELLMLRHVHLSELIETEKNVADMFMSLSIDRSKPAQNPRVSSHARVTPEGLTMMILKNPDNKRYFKLSDQGQFVWEQLNGEHSMQDITLALADKFNIFAPDVVAALISRLAKAGFVSNIKIDEKVNLKSQPIWVRALLLIRNVLEARIAIGNADRWITKLYNHGAKILFTPIGQIALAIVTLVSVLAFVLITPDIILKFKTMPDTWILLIVLLPFTVLSFMLHEIGHALATKAYGYEVHYMGVGWYWFGPVAFTDTSDMWLSTRWPRIVVNLAGIYADILSAGIAILLILIISNPYVQAFLWLYAVFTYLNGYRMLSPLQELDGYYVLMDLLDRPHLRKSSVMWLLRDFPKAIRHPSLFKNNKPEVYYWLACIAYLIVESVVTITLQAAVFKILGIHPSNIFVTLALPVLVVIISSLSVIAEIRSQGN